MAGLGYRQDMVDWDMSRVQAEFYEVAPENWIRRDREPLHRLRQPGQAVCLHGVSLNLGGHAPLNTGFLRDVAELMRELGCVHYSDHLAATGDAHALYDLFPVPFTTAEAHRVSERIRLAQDTLGLRMAIENPTWYTNVGLIPEADFLAEVAHLADCHILLDLNNIEVNHKNHGGLDASAFVARLDARRVSYVHVAGHEFDARFGLHVDTHSQAPSSTTQRTAHEFAQKHGWPILLEWDHDLPSLDEVNKELACLPSLPT